VPCINKSQPNDSYLLRLRRRGEGACGRRCGRWSPSNPSPPNPTGTRSSSRFPSKHLRLAAPGGAGRRGKVAWERRCLSPSSRAPSPASSSSSDPRCYSSIRLVRVSEKEIFFQMSWCQFLVEVMIENYPERMLDQIFITLFAWIFF